jgi:hypothetical protein
MYFLHFLTTSSLLSPNILNSLFSHTPQSVFFLYDERLKFSTHTKQQVKLHFVYFNLYVSRGKMGRQNILTQMSTSIPGIQNYLNLYHLRRDSSPWFSWNLQMRCSKDLKSNDISILNRKCIRIVFTNADLTQDFVQFRINYLDWFYSRDVR